MNWEFIISTCISIISIGIGVWVAVRQPIQLTIAYEAVKNVVVVEDLHYLTFKIRNVGKKSIELPDRERSLILEFKKGARIFRWDELKPEPSFVKVTPEIEAEKVHLILPLLKPHESITIRLLLDHYVNYFPVISARTSDTDRTISANNVRSAKETRIAAYVYVCFAVVLYIRLLPQ